MNRWLLITIFAGYVSVSYTVYRLRNPHLTETQLLLQAHRALLWK